MNKHLAEKFGLYNPANEHDSCGVGFIAQIEGKKTHEIIEKGLDTFGRAAIAQCDIEKFYDSMRCLRMAKWMVDKGADARHVACLLRHQLWERPLMNH